MKYPLRLFCIGFFIAVVVILATLWVNMRHSPPGGAETVNIPAWLRGSHTLYGGAIGGIILQTCCLVFALCSYFKQIKKTRYKVFLILTWVVLLIVSLVIWSMGRFLVWASWMV